MTALFAFGLLFVLIVPQLIILTVAGARRDGTSPLTKEFWL